MDRLNLLKKLHATRTAQTTAAKRSKTEKNNESPLAVMQHIMLRDAVTVDANALVPVHLQRA